MAELVNLGEHCSLQDCQQLDFLPIECSYCSRKFCKDHAFPDRHQCQEFERASSRIVDPSQPSKSETFECHLPECSSKELTPITCSYCSKQVCLQHRHQRDHGCTAYVAPAEPMKNTRNLVEKLTANVAPEAPVLYRPPRNAKAQKTAAKVALMKLKMKSSGNESLPQEERFYFRVMLPKSAKAKMPSAGVFVSENWCLGKVIDSVADLCKVENRNNVANQPKLKLFRHQDGAGLSSDMQTTLKELALKEEIYNGDCFILEYVDDNTEGCVDPKDYKYAMWMARAPTSKIDCVLPLAHELREFHDGVGIDLVDHLGCLGEDARLLEAQDGGLGEETRLTRLAKPLHRHASELLEQFDKLSLKCE